VGGKVIMCESSDIPLYHNSYGSECARHFGVIFALKNGRIPSKEEVRYYVDKSTHKTYSNYYWKRLYEIAYIEAQCILSEVRSRLYLDDARTLIDTLPDNVDYIRVSYLTSRIPNLDYRYAKKIIDEKVVEGKLISSVGSSRYYTPQGRERCFANQEEALKNKYS
jgi:hypothetical protein